MSAASPFLPQRMKETHGKMMPSGLGAPLAVERRPGLLDGAALKGFLGLHGTVHPKALPSAWALGFCPPRLPAAPSPPRRP